MWPPSLDAHAGPMSAATSITESVNTSAIEPLAYHRLALWWAKGHRLRPLWALLLTAFLLLALIILTAVGAIVLEELGMPALLQSFEGDLTAAINTPVGYAFTFGSVAVLLPLTLVAFRLVGCAPIGLLSSVAGRLRWPWLVRTAAAAVAIWVVVAAMGFMVDPTTGLSENALPNTWWLVVAVLVITPFQAAAEEYVFRGGLAQMVGAWLRHPAWAILLPIPLFALGHSYNWIGLVDVSLFALAAGWLTWRTGGLEAAIAMHVVNNTGIGLLGAAGLVDLNLTEVAYTDLIFGLVPVLGFVIWVEWSWRRQGLSRLYVAS